MGKRNDRTSRSIQFSEVNFNQKVKIMKKSLIVLSLLALTACGETPQPAAVQPIQQPMMQPMQGQVQGQAPVIIMQQPAAQAQQHDSGVGTGGLIAAGLAGAAIGHLATKQPTAAPAPTTVIHKTVIVQQAAPVQPTYKSTSKPAFRPVQIAKSAPARVNLTKRR